MQQFLKVSCNKRVNHLVDTSFNNQLNNNISKIHIKMKKNTLKQVLVLIAFVAFAASISSCNKGYGCPNNFKVVKTAIDAIK